MSKWIKCSERMPDTEVAVLGYWAQPGICEGTEDRGFRFDVVFHSLDGCWYSPEDTDSDYVEPTHWKPLPTPPVEL